MGAVGPSLPAVPQGQELPCAHPAEGEEVISLEDEQPSAFPLAGATSAHGTAQVRLGDLGDPFSLGDPLLTQCPS